MHKTILLLSFVTGAVSSAEVNLQEASFIQKQNDFRLPLMARTYNSRSLWMGVYGFGWCAEFEKRVDPLSGQLQLCEQALPIRAQRMGPAWIVKRNRRISEVYNFRGQLMKIKDSSGIEWDLSYDSHGRLSRIHSPKETYDFKYISFQLSKIESRAESTSYRFEGPLLKEARSLRQWMKYRYDDLQNLISVEGSGQNSISIEYNTELDQVRRVHMRDSCSQEFGYKKISDHQFLVRALTRCPSAVPRPLSYLFTARPTSSGKWKIKGRQISGDQHDQILLP